MTEKTRLSLVKCAAPGCTRRLTVFQAKQGQKTCCAECGQRYWRGPKKEDSLSPRDPWEAEIQPMETDMDVLRERQQEREIREIMAEEMGRTGYQAPRRRRSFRERYGVAYERLAG